MPNFRNSRGVDAAPALQTPGPSSRYFPLLGSVVPFEKDEP
jgi:hypothetical protein